MQWLRNAGKAIGRRMGLFKPEDPGTAEFVPDEEPAASPPPAPAAPVRGMTPYGNVVGSRKGGSTVPSPDYFGGRVGASGSALGQPHDPESVYSIDKASMTNDHKQALWTKKMGVAQGLVKKDIASLVAQYGQGGDPMIAKIAKVIATKSLYPYLEKMTATYRKGGQAAAGTMNTLTRTGWKTPTTAGLGEAHDPQQIAAMFEKVKMDMARRLAQPEGGQSASEASADKDIMKLYYGIRQQVGKFAMGLKIGGMPQQNTQPSV